MASHEVQADVHVRSVSADEVALEHGRTESVCQPPPIDEIGGNSSTDEVVFGEDKEFLK